MKIFRGDLTGNIHIMRRGKQVAGHYRTAVRGSIPPHESSCQSKKPYLKAELFTLVTSRGIEPRLPG